MLQDDIRANWPLWKRVSDHLTGRSMSRATAELVGASRLSEHSSRQQVLRRGAELQAALYARAEEIGAPPPSLDADIDSLVYAAAGSSLAARPQESQDPKGYYDWTVNWAQDSLDAAALAFDARRAVERGELDLTLEEGLDADHLVTALKELTLAPGRPALESVEVAGSAVPEAEPGLGVEPEL